MPQLIAGTHSINRSVLVFERTRRPRVGAGF